MRCNQKLMSFWCNWISTIYNKLTTLRSCPLPMFVTLTGRGHDAFVCRITCKKARIWTFFWLDRKRYKWFALFQLVTLARVMSSEYTSSLWNFCRLSFHEFEECLNRNSSIEIFSISSFTLIINWNMQFDTGYKLQKRQTGSLFK